MYCKLEASSSKLESGWAEREDFSAVARRKRHAVSSEKRHHPDVILGENVGRRVVVLNCLDKIAVPLGFRDEREVFSEFYVTLCKCLMCGRYNGRDDLRGGESFAEILERSAKSDDRHRLTSVLAVFGLLFEYLRAVSVLLLERFNSRT